MPGSTSVQIPASQISMMQVIPSRSIFYAWKDASLPSEIEAQSREPAILEPDYEKGHFLAQ